MACFDQRIIEHRPVTRQNSFSSEIVWYLDDQRICTVIHTLSILKCGEPRGFGELIAQDRRDGLPHVPTLI
jgi:hypothetical protein